MSGPFAVFSAIASTLSRSRRDAEVGERDGEADGDHEAHDLVDGLRRGVIEHHLADYAEGDLFAVEVLVRLGQHREAGVYSVRRRESGVEEAEAGEQCVRFDDVFKGLR